MKIINNTTSSIIALAAALFICIGTAIAQPSAVKKSAKNTFKLTTFNEQGDILHTGYGAFVGEDGTCLGNWEPFIGASSAIVIDVQGRRYDVDCLIGANEIYNVAKFRIIVPEGKKMAIAPIPLATEAIAQGGECWFVQYDIKKPVFKAYTPSKVETFSSSLPYYIFEETASDELAGSPFLNANGELLGLMQPAKKRTDIYCPSAQYAITMTAVGLSANEPTLKQTNMRIALPEEYQQALVALMMASSRFGTPAYLATANEFISRFPNATDGYNAKADYLVAQQDYATAEAVMNECIANCEAKEEAHFAFSKIIYNKVVNFGDSIYPAWNFEKAVEEADKAYAINPQPIYTMQKAKTQMLQKKYEEAYTNFLSLANTNMRSGECFYYASLCQQQLNAPEETITALLDSAVACYEKPYRGEAATYILIRAKWYDKIGQPRKAIADLNEYEAIVKPTLNDRFYYSRSQIALNAKLYQIALNDLNKAIELNPSTQDYYVEKGILLIRVKMYDEAIEVGKLCNSYFPDFGDGYAIHGLALTLSGKKAEGIALMQKGKELGSEMAQEFIDNYGK